MTDPGPDGSGVGAAERTADLRVSLRVEPADDRDAKGLQDHGEPEGDEATQTREAERIAQQPDF